MNYEASVFKRTDEESFETFCNQLRCNEAGDVSFGSITIDSDRRAVQLAESLRHNESLYALTLEIWPGEMTTSGAQILGKSIQTSRIFILDVTSEKYNEIVEREGEIDCMWTFYSEVIENLAELRILHPLQDDDAIKLAALLNGDRSLETLSVSLTFVTVEGAPLALVNGIQESVVSVLEITKAWPDACRGLLGSGIMASTSFLRSLEINPEYYPLHDDESLPNGSVFGSLTVPEIESRLQQASQLETMKLNGCFMNSGELKLVAKAMRGNGNLKVIGLAGNDITDRDVPYLVDSCKECLQLDELDLSWNQIGVAGLCLLLKAATSLKTISLSNNVEIGRQGLCSIIDLEAVDGLMTRRFQLPRKFLLNACDLTLKDVNTLLLSKNVCTKNLKSLHLESNRFGDDGVLALVKCLNNQGFLMLQELDLSSNNTSTRCMQTLLRATWTHPSLKVLKVEECKVTGCRELTLIAKELRRSQLEEFRFGVAGGACTNDQSEACDVAAQALLRAVKDNMWLQVLTTRNINIPKQVQSEIDFFLNLDKFGRQLLRFDDGLQPFGLWSHVFAKGSRNASVLYYLLGQQPSTIMSPPVVRCEDCSGSATTTLGKRQKTLGGYDHHCHSVKNNRTG